MDGKNLIVVRDRRKPNHYRIQNSIFKEWLPIIGTTGYTLYSFYVVLASTDEEMSFPGYQLIESFLDISSGTVANYNRLLEWCGLVEVTRFPLSANKPNHYYVLDEPEVTSETINAIYKRAMEYGQDDPFVVMVLKRLNEWRPLQSYYAKPSYPQVVKPAQAEKYPTQAGKYPTQVEKQGTQVEKQGTQGEKYPTSLTRDEQQPIQEPTITTNLNNQEQPTNNNMAGWLDVSSILGKLGISDPLLTTLANKTDLSMAIAMAWWCVTEEWSENPAGLAIQRLKAGKFPPAGYFDLLEAIMAGEVTAGDVVTAAAKGKEFLADLGLGAGAVNAAAAIYKKDKEWFYLEV